MNTTFHRIKRLQVTGGFLVGLDLDLSDGLNTVIGPRGTGKSSVLELIRHGLGLMPGRPGDPLRKRIESLIKKNLDGGRVELTIESKDGLTYILSRAADEEPILMDASRTPLTVDYTHLFGVDIYSQNQIETIAETPHYQLDLIDRFEQEKLREISAQISATEHALRANASRITPLLEENEAVEAETSQLDSVEERLRAFVTPSGENSAEVEKAHAHKALRDRERRALDRVRELLQQQSNSIEELLEFTEEKAVAAFTPEMLAGPNARILANILEETQTIVSKTRHGLEEARKEASGGLMFLQLRRGNLEKFHASQDLEFSNLMEKQQQDLAQSAERTKLEKRRNQLVFKHQRHGEIVELLRRLQAERQQLLGRLSEERNERFAIRARVADRLTAKLGTSIRVTVAQNADSEGYKSFLADTLQPYPIRQISVSSELSKLSPRQLERLVRSGDARELARRGSINLQQAETTIKAFQSETVLMELQVQPLNDLPSIELCDNGNYKNTANLSTGQKCTAILPILMFDSANPLLIDQPEDNLDNRFVYDAIVTSVNKVKGSRQLLFVTHNPNIPVLGDAEQVVVMQSNGRTGGVSRAGTVDDCRDDIINLLEGGATAFELRTERYSRKL